MSLRIIPKDLEFEISRDHWLKDFDIKEESTHTTLRVNTYIISMIDSYSYNGLSDKYLWEEFQIDFEGWNKEDFTTASLPALKRLHAFLESRGVFVQSPRGVGYASALHKLVREEERHQWTTAEIDVKIDKYGDNFKSRLNPSRSVQQTPVPKVSSLARTMPLRVRLPSENSGPSRMSQRQLTEDVPRQSIETNTNTEGQRASSPAEQGQPRIVQPPSGQEQSPLGPEGIARLIQDEIRRALSQQPQQPQQRQYPTYAEHMARTTQPEVEAPQIPLQPMHHYPSRQAYSVPLEDAQYNAYPYTSRPRTVQPESIPRQFDFPDTSRDLYNRYPRHDGGPETGHKLDLAVNTKAQLDLAKIYHISQKYTGDTDDCLDEKMIIFFDNCGKVGVTQDGFAQAFSTMLTGEALNFFHEALVGKRYKFDVLVGLLRGHFETPQRNRNYLDLWNSVSMDRIVRDNPEKNLLECLELTAKTLRNAQKRITSHQTEWDLVQRMISACRTIPECDYATIRPSHSYEGLMADLRAACGNAVQRRNATKEAFLQQQEDDNCEGDGLSEYDRDEHFFVDRKFGGSNNRRQRVVFREGNKFRRGSGSYRSRGRGNFRPTFRPTQPQQMRDPEKLDHDTCYVCLKKGCHSSEHTEEERRGARNRIGRAVYHVTGEKMTDEQFLAYTNDFDPVLEEEEDNPQAGSGFFTELSDSYNFDEQQAYAYLQDNKTMHRLTGRDPFEPSTAPSIFFVQHRYSSEKFRGIMPDTGAAGISTIGRPQFEALLKLFPNLVEHPATGQTVKFGQGSADATGYFVFPTILGDIKFYITPTDTPALWCIQDMDKLKVQYNNLDNTLIQGTKRIPIVREWGHPWWLFDREKTLAYSHFTEQQLKHLHRQWGHPSAQKMYNVLVKSGLDTLSMRDLEEVNRFCRFCQMNEKQPGRFHWKLPTDLHFNASYQLDVFFIDGKPYLHGIDEATGWNVAKRLYGETAEAIWNAIRYMLIDMYQGPPDEFVVDSAKNFNSEEFKANARTMGITVRTIPVEAHNSIGKVERAHAPLRRAFTIMKEDLEHLRISDDQILQMAVKAVNDTAGPNGLVPTLLVFGSYPRISAESPPSPGVTERAKTIKRAMTEIRKIHAERMIKDALNTKRAHDNSELANLPLLSQVRVWREATKSKRGHWTGPFRLISNDKRECVVQTPNGLSTFRCTVVRPFKEKMPEDEELVNDQEEAEPKARPRTRQQTALQHSDGSGKQAFAQELAETCYWVNELQKREDFERYKWASAFVQEADDPEVRDIRLANIVAFLTEKEKADHELAVKLRSEGKITTAGKPFELSDRQEIDSLIAAGVFRFELYNPEIHTERIFKSRLVNEIKGKQTEKPYEKTRLVIQAFNDQGKTEILTQSPTIQRSAQRLLLSFVPSCMEIGMSLFCRDITQAYTQSKSKLARTILAHLPESIRDEYPEGTIMVVVKPLYGIPEAGTHWFATYSDHYEKQLGREPSTYDPCLKVTTSDEVFGIAAMQTDDTLILSDVAFREKEDNELQKAKLLAKPIEILSTDHSLIFNGCIVQQKGANITIGQKGQAAKLKLVNTKESHVVQMQQYREQRARGAYIATICQPEASFDLSVAAQHQNPNDEEVKALNKRLQWQIDNQDRGLIYVPLDLYNLKLFVFVDGSFANNKDLSSQLGYVIALGNEIPSEPDTFKIRANIIHSSSTKSKRVTRAVLASEIYGMVAGVDIAIAINSTIHMIAARLKVPLPQIVCCTDSFSLYECLVKLGTTKEKRLMIDIMALRQSYERRELQEIRWIKGDDNPADCMTKQKANQALTTLIDTNELVVRVEGWVNRQDK